MSHILMNVDRPVLEFDFDDMFIRIIDNDFLPFLLKDYIRDTSPREFSKSLKDIELVRDFFLGRTLNLFRQHAKEILNVASLPQSIRPDDKLKITFACRGLSMTDSFWIKKPDENILFQDVNLRKKKLSEASYEIAIIGKPISATAKELRPDLSTIGMFPKYWKRNSEGVELWKTDMTSSFVNTIAELSISAALASSTASSVKYRGVVRDGRLFAVCDCIANDTYSLVTAQDVKDWCRHTGREFESVVNQFEQQFADMVVCDYIFANTDRHWENWNFLIENHTNRMVSPAPLFDHNQGYIADHFNTNILELTYEPTGMTFWESIKEYAVLSRIRFSNMVRLTPSAMMRLRDIELLSKRSLLSDDIPLQVSKILYVDKTALPEECEEELEFMRAMERN